MYQVNIHQWYTPAAVEPPIADLYEFCYEHGIEVTRYQAGKNGFVLHFAYRGYGGCLAKNSYIDNYEMLVFGLSNDYEQVVTFQDFLDHLQTNC